MDAGKLDRRIRLERATTERNLFGELVPTWGLLDEVWAEVAPLVGREAVAAMELQAERPTRFRIRWYEGFTPLDRVVYDDRVYEVQGVAELGRRDGMEISAIARADKTVSP